MYEVVTIGSITRDHFIEGNYTLIPYPKTPLGRAIALPFGEKIGAKAVHVTIGGNAANAAVTFARQGMRAACAAKLGTDLSARENIALLTRERVITKHIARTALTPSAFSVLLLTGGERTIIGYHGASDTFALRDLNLRKLTARWWYVSLAGESDKMLLPLIRFAKRNGVKLAVNPSGHHIAHRGAEIRKAMRDIDVLVLNAGEAAELVGISFHRERAVFRKLDRLLTPGVVAVTDGPRGVTVSDGKKLYKAGIFKEKAVLDRTGAGDAFGSGFVSVVARGGSIPEAIRFASANATSVVEHVGATEGILRKREFASVSRWRKFPIRIAKAA